MGIVLKYIFLEINAETYFAFVFCISFFAKVRIISNSLSYNFDKFKTLIKSRASTTRVD